MHRDYSPELIELGGDLLFHRGVDRNTTEPNTVVELDQFEWEMRNLGNAQRPRERGFRLRRELPRCVVFPLPYAQSFQRVQQSIIERHAGLLANRRDAKSGQQSA